MLGPRGTPLFTNPQRILSARRTDDAPEVLEFLVETALRAFEYGAVGESEFATALAEVRATARLTPRPAPRADEVRSERLKQRDAETEQRRQAILALTRADDGRVLRRTIELYANAADSNVIGNVRAHIDELRAADAEDRAKIRASTSASVRAAASAETERASASARAGGERDGRDAQHRRLSAIAGALETGDDEPVLRAAIEAMANVSCSPAAGVAAIEGARGRSAGVAARRAADSSRAEAARILSTFGR